ncbi:hypothetical protein [uncultured Lamprocystis sp.]|jgi:hypothetical protein|uniref:hypothetical protein n=1 Tax=uncultured Lamprocystis sp. TaxID=543132 RepID=UPI0025EB3DD0|nr:hypothetical protein [uncultured Lamprocystis sp.]
MKLQSLIFSAKKKHSYSLARFLIFPLSTIAIPERYWKILVNGWVFVTIVSGLLMSSSATSASNAMSVWVLEKLSLAAHGGDSLEVEAL